MRVTIKGEVVGRFVGAKRVAAGAATFALLFGVVGVTSATPALAVVPGHFAIAVTASSYSITYGGAGPATIGYSTDPVTTVDDWTTEPTCAAYEAADTGFLTALTAPYAIGVYVTHCSDGVASNSNLLSYVDGSLTVGRETLYVVPDGKLVTFADALPRYTFTYHSASTAGPVVTPTIDSPPACGSDYTSSTSVSLSPVIITCSGGSDSIYSLDTSATGQLTIAKATSQTVVSCGRLEFTYTGEALTPCIATVGGAGWSLPAYVTATYTDNVNVGTNSASAFYEYPGDANHAPSSYLKHFSILKAPSSTVVTCPTSVPYVGSSVTPCSVSVTGVGGLALTPTPTYADNVAVGLNTASAAYTFDGDDNHSGSTNSQKFSITSAPSVARSVTASPRIRSVLVSWAAPSNPGGATISGYVATVVGSTKKCTATRTQRSCTVSGLTNGVAYKFTVEATNAVGTSSTSLASSAVIAGAPTDPRSLVVSFPAKTLAKVTWGKPGHRNGGAVTGYRVRWCRISSTCTAWSRQPVSPLVLSASGRVTNARYRVEVQARNVFGYGPAAITTFTQTP